MKVIKIILLTIVLVVVQYNYVYAQEVERGNFESQILKILEDQHVPGAAITLVSKDSIIWKRTLGLADIENKIQVTDNTLFASGSISKTFVSSAAMIAQEKGLLKINAPIEKLVPSLEHNNQWNQTSPVRFAHLLEHTSGFDEAHFNLFPRTNSSTPFDEVMKMSKSSLDTRWEPGKYFEYNTLGYIASAYIIEKNVDMDFERFVQDNILLPLEMNTATYHPKDNLTPNFSKGYAGIDCVEVPFPDLAQWPAGFMTTTIGDMSKFIMMLLNNGQFNNKQILSPTSVKQMETPETSLSSISGIRYGYGKGLWGKFERGYLFHGHPGRAGGFLSEFGYSRELDLGYVILLNSIDGGKAIKAIKSVLLSSIEMRKNEPLNQSSELVTSQLSDVEGCFQPITSIPQLGKIGYFVYRLIDMQIIEEENGQLYQSGMLGDKQVLLHVRDLLFKSSREPMASSAFVEVEGESWKWLTNDASYRQIPMWWGYTQFYVTLICLLIMVIAFIGLFFWIPVRLIRKKKENMQLHLLLFIALCSLTGMIISIVLFYDPEKMYSLGAILFFTFGWLFFALSFLALVKAVIIILTKKGINAWIKYHALLIALACCLSASYLFYWNIIGLKLWNY